MSIDDKLRQKTEALSPHFKPQFLGREHTSFNFRFDEGEPFYLVVEGNRFTFAAGTFEDATLTVYVDNHMTCWDLLAGKLSGMDAFMQGRYRADGNIVLSQLLLYLFKRDDPTIAYEVKD